MGDLVVRIIVTVVTTVFSMVSWPTGEPPKEALPPAVCAPDRQPAGPGQPCAESPTDDAAKP